MCRESRKERSLGKVVTALVDNIIAPLIGILVGGLDFTGLSVKVGEATIGYGAFIQDVVLLREIRDLLANQAKNSDR